MMLTISGFARGKCVWCRKEDEGVDAKFHDGLQGFFCRKHLWEAIRARAEKKDIQSAQPEAGRKSA
jgi:hypothetical protein